MAASLYKFNPKFDHVNSYSRRWNAEREAIPVLITGFQTDESSV
jgi:hypothetical protein